MRKHRCDVVRNVRLQVRAVYIARPEKTKLCFFLGGGKFIGLKFFKHFKGFFWVLMYKENGTQILRSRKAYYRIHNSFAE